MKNSLLKNGLVLAALVGAFSVAPASKAEAAFAAYICNDVACAGGDDVAVLDNNGDSLNGGVDSVALAGFINLTVLNFAGYDITVNQAQSQPFLANGMDLNYSVSTGTSGGGGDIYLYAATTNYTASSASGILGGTSDNGSVTAAICTLPTNGLNVPFTLAGNCTTSSDNTPPAININVARAGLATPYTLVLGVRVNLTGAGTTATGDFRVNTVPEPALMSLFGLGLAGLAITRRRRKA